jgi:hypothetical protein
VRRGARHAEILSQVRSMDESACRDAYRPGVDGPARASHGSGPC